MGTVIINAYRPRGARILPHLIAFLVTGYLLPAAALVLAEPPRREVVAGYTTTRLIPGVPYDLAGKRIVFANWNFIQPGDLDWVNDAGQSVYVHGNEDPFTAHHVGIEAPFGIRISARRPVVIGPLERPHRCIIQDGNRYLGWTDNEFYESSDGMTRTKKANLKLDQETDGIFHVFIDPRAFPTERFKPVWTYDGLTKSDLDAYLKKYPDDWEPRALLHFREQGKVSCLRGIGTIIGYVGQLEAVEFGVEPDMSRKSRSGVPALAC